MIAPMLHQSNKGSLGPGNLRALASRLDFAGSFHMSSGRRQDVRNFLCQRESSDAWALLGSESKLEKLYGLEVRVVNDLPNDEVYFVAPGTFESDEIVTAHRLREMFSAQEAAGSALPKRLSKLLLRPGFFKDGPDARL